MGFWKNNSRSILIFANLGVSWVAAYYGEEIVKSNSDAILILVTVITVFAGFLVAIITVLGDPSLIPAGSWRVAENRRRNIEADLIRHTWLFVFYLLAIGALFVGAVAKGAPSSIVPDLVKIWLTRLYLFFGLASFLFTFGLAGSLLRYQMQRYDAEIKRRRLEDGVRDDE
jgi:hypothetical protein